MAKHPLILKSHQHKTNNMHKKLYSQVYTSQKTTLNSFARFQKEWNSQFKDSTGTYISTGRRTLSDRHYDVFKAISYIFINRISLQNRRNKSAKYPKMFDITEPIEFLVNTNDIRNVMTKSKDSVTLRTIRNRISRLEDASIIEKEFDKSKNGYLMKISPLLVPLFAEKDGIIPENCLFLDRENQYFSPKQRLFLPNYIKEKIKKEIKKEHLNNVDKGNGASTNITKNTKNNSNTRTTEAIPKISVKPSVQTRKYSKKMARIFGLSKEQERDTANDLQNNLPQTLQKSNNTKHQKEAFERLRKNFALEFYVRFIITFYGWTSKLYMPQTAGSSTIFYVEQALKEVETNKDYYFGACKTAEHLEYQRIKLEKAMKSTLLSVQKKRKHNPDYNWKYNYPNTFLSKNPGKNNFSFKNSILHVEKTMIRTQHINAEYESEMTEHKLNLLKESQQKLINTAVWYIHQNTNRATTNINVTLQYFKDDEDLRNNFKALILNRFAVKKWLAENKDFKPDQLMINDCFGRQERLEKEINELLPDLHKKIRYSEKNRSKVGKYVMMGDDYQPTIRFYNDQTYNFISNLVN